MEKLNFDDESAPGFVLRFEVEDAELGAGYERGLLGRQEREGHDAARALKPEEIVEEGLGEAGVVREDEGSMGVGEASQPAPRDNGSPRRPGSAVSPSHVAPLPARASRRARELRDPATS